MMHISYKKSYLEEVLFFYFILIQGILTICFSERILPTKYFYDSETIRAFYSLTNDLKWSFFSSYENTARFYSIFGLDYVDSRIIEGIFNYSLFFVLFFLVYYHSRGTISLKIKMLILVWNIPLSIYIGQLTKEIIPIILFSMQLLILNSNRKLSLFFVLLLVVFYGLFFRIYWFISLYITLILYLIIKSKHSSKLKFLLFVLGIIVLFLAADINGTYLTDFRGKVNENRIGSEDANTLIQNVFYNTSFITDALNWLVSWLSLILPLNLITNFEIIHVLFVILNVYCVILFIKMYLFFTTNRIGNKGVYWSLCWMISFSLTQGIFEPDLGSFLKHEITLLPMFFYLLIKYTTYKRRIFYESASHYK